MPGALIPYLVPYRAGEAVTLALALVLAGALALMGYRRWIQRRVTPEERERARRSVLVARGKMGDASVLEFREGLLFYTYSVRGVVYTASQDTAGLADRLPQDLSRVGAAWVKYDPKNPANSIIFSEDWIGLQAHKVG
jgi:hypothetical protein